MKKLSAKRGQDNMANGEAVNDRYVASWCNERHREIEDRFERNEERIDLLQRRVDQIFYLMLGNLATLSIGIIVAIFKSML